MNQTAATTAVSCPKLRPLFEYLDGLRKPADLEMLRGLLKQLDVQRRDLAAVCIFRPERYQRNLVRATEFFELVCMCWASGQRTPIHDHAGSSCAFLVVEGTATESRFERTPSGLVCPVWTREREPGYICASTEADIHQVANAQPPGMDLITLHIYSPELRNFNVYSLDTPCASDPATVRHNTEIHRNDGV